MRICGAKDRIGDDGRAVWYGPIRSFLKKAINNGVARVLPSDM